MWAKQSGKKLVLINSAVYFIVKYKLTCSQQHQRNMYAIDVNGIVHKNLAHPSIPSSKRMNQQKD